MIEDKVIDSFPNELRMRDSFTFPGRQPDKSGISNSYTISRDFFREAGSEYALRSQIEREYLEEMYKMREISGETYTFLTPEENIDIVNAVYGEEIDMSSEHSLAESLRSSVIVSETEQRKEALNKTDDFVGKQLRTVEEIVTSVLDNAYKKTKEYSQLDTPGIFENPFAHFADGFASMAGTFVAGFQNNDMTLMAATAGVAAGAGIAGVAVGGLVGGGAAGAAAGFVAGESLTGFVSGGVTNIELTRQSLGVREILGLPKEELQPVKLFIEGGTEGAKEQLVLGVAGKIIGSTLTFGIRGIREVFSLAEKKSISNSMSRLTVNPEITNSIIRQNDPTLTSALFARLGEWENSVEGNAAARKLMTESLINGTEIPTESLNFKPLPEFVEEFANINKIYAETQTAESSASHATDAVSAFRASEFDYVPAGAYTEEQLTKASFSEDVIRKLRTGELSSDRIDSASLRRDTAGELQRLFFGIDEGSAKYIRRFDSIKNDIVSAPDFQYLGVPIDRRPADHTQSTITYNRILGDYYRIEKVYTPVITNANDPGRAAMQLVSQCDSYKKTELPAIYDKGMERIMDKYPHTETRRFFKIGKKRTPVSDESFNRDVIIGIHDGTQAIQNNRAAVAVVREINRLTEESTRAFNKEGYLQVTENGRYLPMRHDSALVEAKGIDKWVESLDLDWERMIKEETITTDIAGFATNEERTKILSGIYEDIISGNVVGYRSATQKGVMPSGRRKLLFSSGEAAYNYMREYTKTTDPAVIMYKWANETKARHAMMQRFGGSTDDITTLLFGGKQEGAGLIQKTLKERGVSTDEIKKQVKRNRAIYNDLMFSFNHGIDRVTGNWGYVDQIQLFLKGKALSFSAINSYSADKISASAVSFSLGVDLHKGLTAPYQLAGKYLSNKIGFNELNKAGIQNDYVFKLHLSKLSETAAAGGIGKRYLEFVVQYLGLEETTKMSRAGFDMSVMQQFDKGTAYTLDKMSQHKTLKHLASRLKEAGINSSDWETFRKSDAFNTTYMGVDMRNPRRPTRQMTASERIASTKLSVFLEKLTLEAIPDPTPLGATFATGLTDKTKFPLRSVFAETIGLFTNSPVTASNYTLPVFMNLLKDRPGSIAPLVVTTMLHSAAAQIIKAAMRNEQVDVTDPAFWVLAGLKSGVYGYGADAIAHTFFSNYRGESPLIDAMKKLADAPVKFAKGDSKKALESALKGARALADPTEKLPLIGMIASELLFNEIYAALDPKSARTRETRMRKKYKR